MGIGNMKVLFLAIDVQKDFMDDGALGVPGAYSDVSRMVSFITENSDKITNIAVSLDTHTPHQIFHPAWWIDKEGKNPTPYTVITSNDIDSQKYIAVNYKEESYDYVKNLEALGKKSLTIWPYHCIQGTPGASLEESFAKAVFDFSVSKGTDPIYLVKGLDPLSEMYGIIKPEYSKHSAKNISFLRELTEYDKIVIAGEAKSHCVQESISQILDFYKENSLSAENIYVLEDCMTSIGGFEASCNETFEEFKKIHKVKLVNSKDDFL